MADPSATFSESWYRIAHQRLSLRPDVIVRRQRFRGERWYVLQHPFANRHFRLQPDAYALVARLSPDRTVEQVWRECVDRFPDAAPGQEAVLQLLAQLYFADLLRYPRAEDSAQLFRRHEKRRQRQIAARLLTLMFMRFPLLDPDRFLVRTLPFVGRLAGWFGGVLWLVTVGLGLKVVADHFPALWAQGQGVIAPENLPLLYLALVVVKTLHEFGHAYFCRKYGGEVHVMGVMLMIFTPIPYVDASSSSGFRSRWQRMLVGAAGMIVEVFLAAVAALVWAATGDGLVHSLAYNVMFIASVSTLLFNANPLLRFDGYYMLSDWLEIPNLAQRANWQLRHLWERHVYGVKPSSGPARSRREAAWLVFYSIASGIYRVVVFTGVLLIVADQFLLLGIVMVIICGISWVVVPLGKFVNYLVASPRLSRVRPRAAAVSGGLVAVLVTLLAVIPFPSHFRAPGIVQAQERFEVVNNVAGVVEAVLAESGQRVTRGQPLLRLRSVELEVALREAAARHDEITARLREALSRSTANRKPLESRLESVRERLAKLEADQAALTVRARHDGIWVAPPVRQMVGRNLARGTSLGLVINPGAFEFVATVAQTDADAAFGRAAGRAFSARAAGEESEPIAAAAGAHAEVRLHGQAGAGLEASRWKVVPGGQLRLPSAALGWAAGGEIPVSASEPDRAVEPFFQVRAELPAAAVATLVHGRSGVIRFDLPAEPLLPRWLRRLGQLLQKRYQV